MINLLSEYELALGQLPVEPDSNQVFYVESRKNQAFEDYIRNNYDMLRRMFAEKDLEFVYLPLYAENMTAADFEASALYYLPWLKKGDLDALRDACHIELEDLFGELHLKDGKPAMVNAKGRAFKLDVPSPEERFLHTIFYEIADAYDHGKICECSVRFGLDKDDAADSGSIRFRKSLDPVFRDIDPELVSLFSELVSRKPDWAVKAMLSKMLEEEEVISRLVITERLEIVLPDYNGIKINMTPKEKAIYALFLKHPEGLYFKDLPSYRDELARYYRHVTKRDDPQAIEAAIDSLVGVINGDADIQRSRIKSAIKKAFSECFCEHYSRWYIIEGKRGEVMKIELPREKVVWEVDL